MCLRPFLQVAILAAANLLVVVPLGHTQLKPQQPATGSQTAAGSAGQASTVPEPGETFRDCADCTEMVVVPDGEFKMGSGELG